MARIKFHNLNVVIDRIKAVGGGAEKYMSDVIYRCMHEDVWPRWVAHTNLQDHSLQDLARLGHPYSTRFDVDSFIHPDAEVHEQSGSVAESSHIVGPESIPGGIRYTLVCDSPHYIFLRYGTRYMRMRDPAGDTMAEALPYIKRRFAREVKAAIVKYYTT